MLFGSHIGIYANYDWSYMNDFQLIFFLDNHNRSIDNKIGFLSGTVP